MYKGMGGFALLILPHFSKISHENEIIWSQADCTLLLQLKLGWCHRIFKNGGRGGTP